MLAVAFQGESGFVSAQRCVCVFVSGRVVIVLRPGGDKGGLNDSFF